MATPPSTLDDEIRSVLQDGVGQLQGSRIDPYLAAPLLEVLQRGNPPSTLQRDLDATGNLLLSMARRIDAAERVQADRHPLGPTWFEVHCRDLERIPGPERAASLAAMWLSAFDGEQFDLCDRIAALAPAADLDDDVRVHLLAASSAFAAARPADALPALPVLARALPTIAVPVTVLQARIHLRETRDTTAALHAAARAEEIASDGADGPRALALAVLAEVQLVCGRPEGAADALAAALALPVHDPDVHLVGGLVEQHRANWRLMDDHYDEAARRFVERGTHVRLVRVAPANLRWRMARQLSTADPARALGYVEEALEAGIVGRGAFPERKALCDKARIQQRLGDWAAAARTYGEAADRYAWTDAVARAVNLYQQAIKLAPGDPDLAWGYAEVLRTQVEDDDTIVDRDLAERARRLLRDGMAQRQPGPSNAWVLAADAMLGLALGDPFDDITFLLERALMLDGDYAPVHALLITVLRLGGHIREAVAAARSARRLSAGDAGLIDAIAAALADAGDPSAALQVISGHPVPDDTVSLRAAVLHLQHGDAGSALNLLDTAAPSPHARIVRGLAQESLGRPEQAALEFEALRADLIPAADDVAPGTRRTAAMAAYHAGHYSEAVRILEGLGARGPRDSAHALDLGIVLLVSGNPDTGGAQLVDAVEGCTAVEDLVFLDRLDIPTARSRVRGLPHERAAVAVLDATAARCTARIATLRAAVRSAGRLPTRAVEAREAMAEGRFADAVERHLDLLDDAPEARHAVARAVGALTDRGDEQFRHGGADEARAAWLAALPGAAATDGETVTALQARIAVSHLAGDDYPTALATMSVVLRGDAAVAALSGALRLREPDVTSAWRYRDRLLALGDDVEPGPRRRALHDAAEAVPLGRAYRLGRDAVPASTVFPMFTPVELRLPASHRALVGSPELGSAVRALRRRLAATTGIRIPGVRIVPADGHDAEMTVAVYGVVVHRHATPPGGRPATEEVVATLADTLRMHMHRMIGTDDVELWLAGWDDPAVAAWEGQRPDAAGRLRVARVLRRLLREGVPVTDRASIMAGFLAAEHAGENTAGILRRVRLGLSVDVLCGGADRVRRALPPEIAGRIRAGIDGTGWRCPRADAESLLADMRRWRSALPDDVVITVDDHVLRPVVWKLLASAGTPSTVLSAEEDTR